MLSKIRSFILSIKSFKLSQSENTLNNPQHIIIPLRYVKYCLAVVFLLGFVYVGALWKVSHEMKVAQEHKEELAQLRNVNEMQQQQLQQLTVQAAALQQNVNRISQLEADIQNLLNASQGTETSRAGVVRTGPGGQGGPGEVLSSKDLSVQLDQMNQVVVAKEQSLSQIKDQLLQRSPAQSTRGFSWPVQGTVTSPFGWRSSPFGSGSDFHPGVDIAGNYGDPVSATADGVVVTAGWAGGYGILVEIDHGNGIHTLYGHNQYLLVQQGQTVKKGDIISLMGSTGLSTGPHTHYEIRVNGTAVDPFAYLN